MFEIGKLVRLDLGYQGENKARVIAIDMTAWLEEFPGAAVGMMLRRPDEDVFYPAALEMEDGIIEFVVTRSDVAIAGEGEAQIILTNEDDVELRSRVVKTKINPSMSGTEVEAPPPENTFVTQVINAAAQAEAAVEKMPSIGENGNWYAWDAAKGVYVDTGKPSKGAQGPAGPKGDKGDTGPQGPVGHAGATGPKGEKGDTGEKGATGPTGPQGATGPQGPKGDKGDTGPQGPAGADGKNGTGVTILGSYDSEDELNAAHPTGKAGDAYLIGGDLYVWSPTKNVWENVGQLQGPKGDKGDTGATGPQGPAGPQGEQGPKGDKGDTGPKGDTGEKGDTGSTGETGLQGPPGTSVTITNISESEVDGGTNVVTFSDGNTLRVKNGKTGTFDETHTQDAGTITGGTFSGKVQGNAAAMEAIDAAQLRDIYAGTADLTAGTSALPTGTLYFVYE